MCIRDSSNTFEAVHVELPLRLLRHCQTAGVPQYIHMSALPASAECGPSRYLYSRGKGEDAVHQQGAEVAVTSLRPSIVFGSNDHFFFSFAAMLRWMPVLPLACPNSRFAPVFVGDVVEAYCAWLHSRSALPATDWIFVAQRFTRSVN